MQVAYAIEPELSSGEFLDILHRSTLAERRPAQEPATLAGMLRQASVIVTARHQSELIGVSRAISDGAYCTYLSDLAVDRRFQRQGIGRRLIELTHQEAGLGTNLILLAAPAAASYYPHIGMQPHKSCWIIPRQEQQAGRQDESESHPASMVNSPANLPSGEVRVFFDALSGEYEAAISRCVPWYRQMLSALIDYLPTFATGQLKILELGCGTGNLSVLLAHRFANAELTLLDISSASLDICKNRLPAGTRATYLPLDMETAEFESNTFDMILSSIAIHHLSRAAKQALFVRCRRWLRPGGVLAYCDQFAGVCQHVNQRHMEQWKQAALGAGSSLEEWEIWMQHQRDHDHHDSLPDQMHWLNMAGFERIDCPWRYLLWTVLQARKPE